MKRFFDIRRQIHNLSMLNFPPVPPTTTTRGTRRKASASSESQPSSSEAKTQLTDFSQIPKILCACFRCMTSFTPPGLISYLGFYFDICEWHIHPARAWTHALMLHLTNPCAKWKVLSQTKLKGKIYKTKSLGHYFTGRGLACIWDSGVDKSIQRLQKKSAVKDWLQ